MGADMCLNSVFEPFLEKLKREMAAKPPPVVRNGRDMVALLTAHYEKMCESGGYFRNGYNAGDVMWAMGLSWQHTVLPMLTKDDFLPIAQARELIALIEARPLTREVVGAHIFKNFTDGRDAPLPQVVHESVAKARGEPVPEMMPPDFDEMYALLNKRRDELLALLRKSIELDEPLACSL
jgi:hypothetical protein